MNPSFVRLPRTIACSGPDRRQVARQPAEVMAVLTSMGGHEAAVRLADVSTHGCRIQGQVAWLRPGAFISIALADEPPLRAIVRWMRDGAAGMEFLQPVPADRREWHDLIDSPFGT